jgi:hypothetical protein
MGLSGGKGDENFFTPRLVNEFAFKYYRKGSVNQEYKQYRTQPLQQLSN